MTRINAGIPPSQLSNAHLLAEHREIKRLPNHFNKHGIKGIIPQEFKLGQGHVMFFLNKGSFTLKRYKEIYLECIKRGFNVQDYSSAWDVYKTYPNQFNDYKPTTQAIELIRQRIKERS